MKLIILIFSSFLFIGCAKQVTTFKTLKPIVNIPNYNDTADIKIKYEVKPLVLKKKDLRNIDNLSR